MHTIKLTVEDDIYHNIMFLLSNLNVKGLTIDTDKKFKNIEDLSCLESEIDRGIASGISQNSHEDVINKIKLKYV
ncbi:MAG: hypothetical protein M0Q24_04800 [Sulfurimonas sp.]|uniref:hypothetical protein n=1 Tax=Sulfurimonas sp. TaxID=2022749 RepID=UPI0025D6496E|nr:hypothetical protein [Sulfurimonas sp.]MCK9491388.1 hypothetical protein [Sulfurimonas sp.]